jgi:hypothetical protein
MPAAAVRQDEALPEELEQLFQEHSRFVYRLRTDPSDV